MSSNRLRGRRTNSKEVKKGLGMCGTNTLSKAMGKLYEGCEPMLAKRVRTVLASPNLSTDMLQSPVMLSRGKDGGKGGRV